jgi:hypothetical protein
MSEQTSSTSELLEAIKKLSNEDRLALVEALNKPEPEPELTEIDKLRQELFNTQTELACLKNRMDRKDIATLNTYTLEEQVPSDMEFESCCPFSFDIASIIKWFMIIVISISIIQTIMKIANSTRISGLGGSCRPFTFPVTV